MRQRTKRSPLTRTTYTTPIPSYILHSLHLPPTTSSIQTPALACPTSTCTPVSIYTTLVSLLNLKTISWLYRCGWRQSGGKDGVDTRHHCLLVLLLWEHFPALSSCSKHYVVQPSAGHTLMCQWPCKADNHHCAGERWAPTLPLQPINPAQTRVYPHC